MLKQAQALQKDMLKVKDEIDSTEFVGESSLVKVTLKGTREAVKVEIDLDDDFEKEDLEALEDMIVLAINDANKKIDAMTEKKMGILVILRLHSLILVQMQHLCLRSEYLPVPYQQRSLLLHERLDNRKLLMLTLMNGKLEGLLQLSSIQMYEDLKQTERYIHLRFLIL